MARLNYVATLKEFRTRAQLKNLGVEYDEDIKVPCAQATGSGSYVIKLPLPHAEWDEEKWIDWDFSAEHELGHLMPSCIDAYEVLERYKIDTSKFFGGMLNIMEDNRQEYTDFGKFEGRKQRLVKGRRQFWKNLPLENLAHPEADEHRLAMESFFVWDNMIREDWMRGLAGSSERLLKVMTPQQLEWIDKLQQGDYESTLRSGISAEEEYHLVKRIIDEVYPFDADDEEKQAQQGNGDGQPNKDKGEGADSGEDGEGEGEATEGEGEQATRTSAQEVNYSDLMAHDHSEQDGEDSASYAPLKIHYDDRQDRAFRPVDVSEYVLHDYTDGSSSIKPNTTYRPRMNSGHGAGLAKHVRRLLQVRSQSTYQHGKKRGKVSPKSIYRGALNGPASEKVFKKRIDNDILNSAVTLLCDFSGSMGGNKVVNAAISAKLLNEAISAINIPLEIITFDNRMAPRHGLIKNFSQRVTADTLLDRMATATDRQMCNNSDGESILWAYDRLVRRKEKRKVLIVLSDGQPAAGRGDADSYTKEIVKEIEKHGDISIYGIGIEDRNVKRIYKQWVTIQDSSELEGALLSIIEKKILE